MWAAQRTYAVGPALVGVRTDDPEVAAWLDATLGRHVVAEPIEARFSLVTGAGRQGSRVRRLPVLYEEDRPVARGPDLAGVARALLVELEALAAAARTDALYLHAGVVRLGARSALLDADALADLTALAGLAERAGVGLPEGRLVRLAPTTGELLPPAPLLVGDLDAAVSALPGARPAAPPPSAPDLVLTLGPGPERRRRPAPLELIESLAGWALNLAWARAAGLGALVRLARRCPALELRADDARAVLTALPRVASAAAGARPGFGADAVLVTGTEALRA